MKSLRILSSCALLLILLAAPAVSSAETGSFAPINPEFLEFRRNGAFSSTAAAINDGPPSGYRPSPLDLSHIVSPSREAFATTSAIPTRYDLREHNAVTPVRNQGNYGTCWSFSTFGSLESTFKKAGAGEFDFSEWHLAYFAYVDESAERPAFTADAPEYGGDPVFDQGGNSTKSTAILARWTGAVNESDRPYPTAKPWPESSRPRFTDPVSKHLEHTLFLGGQFDTAAVKAALMTYGAVSILVNPWNNGAFNNDGTNYYNAAGTGSGGHCITIVGWDDNYPAVNFGIPPSGNGAWLIKNSWGTATHTQGYFWLSYHERAIRDPAVFLGADRTNFERNYQYDPLGWTTGWGYGNTTGWFANIFTAAGPSASGDAASARVELLQAVSFYAGQAGSSYRIEVRTGVSPNAPQSGSLAYIGESTFATAGYRTVRLPSGIPLTAGERFSVVVRLTTPGYNFPIPIEARIAGYSDNATANPGESFISRDGTAWTDLTTVSPNANVCLKAFTSTAAAPTPVPTPQPDSGGGGGCSTAGAASGALMLLLPLSLLLKKSFRP